MKNIFNMFKRRSKPKRVETTYKEVKRKAKKGEWVKITDPRIGFATKYKGDIVQIIDDKEHFLNYKGIGPDGWMSNPDYPCALYTSEYVVLEGYKNGEQTEE